VEKVAIFEQIPSFLAKSGLSCEKVEEFCYEVLIAWESACFPEVA